MMKSTSNSLPYQRHAPWPLRKVVLVVAGVSLGIWGFALAAILG